MTTTTTVAVWNGPDSDVVHTYDDCPGARVRTWGGWKRTEVTLSADGTMATGRYGTSLRVCKSCLRRREKDQQGGRG